MKSKLFATASLAAIILGFAASSALAAPAVTVTPTWDHPSAKVGVSGTGFTPGETIDIYFDTTDELLAVADSGGKFAKHTFKSPGDVRPGQHWVTAIGRKAGDAAQKPFTVSTAWAEFGFKPNGKRDNPWENVISAGNVKKLDTAWIASAGNAFFGAPAIVNGVAYAASEDGKLYAFDAAAGSTLWTATTGGSIFSSPALANGVVYVGSRDGSLHAFSASTGANIWSAATQSWVDSSPAVSDGVVYVGSTDGYLYAFDAGNGAKLWSAQVGPSALNWFSPTVANGIVYFGGGGYLHAFDAHTGALLWASGNYSSQSAPAVANGRVYATTIGLTAYDAVTGTVKWQADMDGWWSESSPAIAEGIVYCTNGGGELFAFDATTGSTLWKAHAGSEVDFSSPAVANGVVYVGSYDAGSLDAFDALTGNLLWSAPTGFVVDSSPAIADGMVFIGSQDQHLYAYALNGGDNAVYKHRHTQPPSFASLHPDYRLKP